MALRVPSDVLIRTPIYRIVHVECLATLLARDALHAPSCAPNDGQQYRGIHARQTQFDRGNTAVPCGAGGVIQDYVGFYFGPRSPMLNRIRTGWNVEKVEQEAIVYLVSTAQAVDTAGLAYAFTDRHSLARVAAWRCQLAALGVVDFSTTYAQWWNNTAQHPDRQEIKQAEFLVHRTLPWAMISQIGVYTAQARDRVGAILAQHPRRHHPAVTIERSWYY